MTDCNCPACQKYMPLMENLSAFQLEAWKIGHGVATDPDFGLSIEEKILRELKEIKQLLKNKGEI